ncbi:unnamed protein product [Linum trigynum]|uniref:Retrotransposon Copia-like N-terminal domain-containing protein n=1 Tax=Linum trigynum TaxID=586398 RepID=A0AAV2G3V1_9ROSI
MLTIGSAVVLVSALRKVLSCSTHKHRPISTLAVMGLGDGDKEKGTMSDVAKDGPDPSSPYYLHPSDQPGQVFVGELLTELNYGEWASDMRQALLAKNKLAFVTGKLTKDAEGWQSDAWERCNAMVMGWLKNSMLREVRLSVRYAETAQQIWSDLKERFGMGSMARLYQLRRSIALHQQEKVSVSGFYTKLRSLWDEIQSTAPIPKCTCGHCTCGIEKQMRDAEDSNRLFDFLIGLDDVFTTVRSQVLSMRPTPTLGEAFQMVSNDEQQRLITSNRRPQVEAAALQTQRDPAPTDKGESHPCTPEGRPFCTHCQKAGHFKDRCYEIIGWPSETTSTRDQASGRGGRGRSGAPQAAQVDMNEVSIPGLSAAQIELLKTFLKAETKTTADPMVNMAGVCDRFAKVSKD